MKLSVIIVNYQVKHYLAQCIDSVQKSMRGIEGEIIVVDNDSRDGSVAYLKRLYPDVSFIENDDNVGFARANNMAIRQSKGEYVLLLNPDTIVGEHLFHDCIALLDSNPEIGATGARMLNPNGTFAPESRRGVPTPFTAFCKMIGLCKLMPESRTFGRYYQAFLDEYETAPIEIVSGACMFIRRSALDKTGLLDETFFMYGEDIDLSFRLLLAGYQNYYIPSRIVHYKGESTQKNTYRYVYVFYQAMYIFFKKHFSGYSLLISLPIKTAIYLKGASEFIARKLHGWIEKPVSVLDSMRDKRFLLRGSNRTLEAMIGICEKYNLPYDLKEVPYETPDYIVFDVDSFSYDEMMAEIEKRSKDAKTRVNLATYSTHQRCIITASYVFEA